MSVGSGRGQLRGKAALGIRHRRGLLGGRELTRALRGKKVAYVALLAFSGRDVGGLLRSTWLCIG